MDDDARWMRLALDEAARGRGGVEPNPMVGAAVVLDGRLIAVGHHRRFGGPHAEIEALEAAGEEARGATLYVTLEPCCHHGKTPPCTEAVLRSGVARVVVGHRDPFPKVAGGGIARLRDAGLDVAFGPKAEAEAAAALNAPFLKRILVGTPYVLAKWAMTLDGKTAVAGGDSRWISSPESRALVHEVRGRMDGILVGVGTVLADDPQLTARPAGPRTPARIVLDSTLRTPVDSALVRTSREVATILFAGGSAPEGRRRRLESAGCEVVVVTGGPAPDVRAVLEELGRRAMTNVLVEGGGMVLGAFFDAGAVDEVDVFIAPVIEGGDHARTPVRGPGCASMAQALRLAEVRRSPVGPDVRIRGEVPRPWRDRAREALDPTLDSIDAY